MCNVPLSEGIGIIKHQRGSFKTYAMLLAVCAVLLLVPFEWHACLKNSFYMLYVQLSIQPAGKLTEILRIAPSCRKSHASVTCALASNRRGAVSVMARRALLCFQRRTQCAVASSQLSDRRDRG